MTSALTDRSWELKVLISDLQTERSVRVHGSTHIGALMLKLVDSLNVARDWSDFGLFWTDKNSWLLRTKSTLDQLGVTSSSKLTFTSMNKPLTVVLPDLHPIHTYVDFSANVFSVVAKLCSELGIRHFEELSLCRHLRHEELKRNRGVSATRKTQFGGSSNGVAAEWGGSPHRLSGSSTPQGTLANRSTPTHQRQSTPNFLTTPTLARPSSNHQSPASANSLLFDPDCSLVNSARVENYKELLYYPKNLAEKARINAGWLDSSRSLLEQGVNPDDLLLLKFKFFNFYDLNPKLDQVRINQLYEQARWSVVSEEVDCTEEEMVTLAALQFQVEQHSSQTQDATTTPSSTTTTTAAIATPTSPDHTDDDEIDAALDDLQNTLEGSCYVSTSSPGNQHHHQHHEGAGMGDFRNSDLTHVPELKAIMKFYKLKKFGLRSSKKHLFVLKETILMVFDRKTQQQKKPLLTIDLRGSEVTAEVNVSSQKFLIKLHLPSSSSPSPSSSSPSPSSSEHTIEYCIRPASEKSYADWMAAFKLATQGRTMADPFYETEVQAILSFLQIHHPFSSSVSSTAASPHHKARDFLKDSSFNVDCYVAPRFVNKLKGVNQLLQKILDAQRNMGDMAVADAKLAYLRLWQSLPEYANTYFIVRHKNSKKEELLAITPTRLLRMDALKGEVLKAWSFQTLESWNVNWEIKQVQVCLEGETLMFQCLTADCKVVHEFIGGYIFLSMRSNDPQQSLDHQLFHKLTSGWE